MHDIALPPHRRRDQYGRFTKGHSGNPIGRPAGLRNRATLVVEALLESEAQALTRKALDLALEGDTTALRLCLDRVVAPRRERAVAFHMPPIAGPGDLGSAMAALAAAATQGLITPSEAAQLAQVVETYIRAVAASDFDRRLSAMEGTAFEQD